MKLLLLETFSASIKSLQKSVHKEKCGLLYAAWFNSPCIWYPCNALGLSSQSCILGLLTNEDTLDKKQT